MKRITYVVTTVVILCLLAMAATYATDLLPSTTGYNLGSASQRWNAFVQNIDISGTCIYHGLPCFGVAHEPVDVGVTYNGAPTASLTLVRHPFPFAVTIPSGCTNSHLIAETAATAEATFSLQKCTAVGACAGFGTAVFASSGTSATFTCATSVSFTSGQYIKLIAPGTPDATLALIGGGIYGTR